MREIEFFNTKMHSATMQETVVEIDRRIQQDLFTQHVVVNVAKLVNMQTDPQLKAAVEACDIINIDGVGVVWGARFLGYDVADRVAGVDLFYELLKMSQQQGYSVFFLGATEEVVEKTNQMAKKLYPNLIMAGYHHGYFWDNEKEVVEKIHQSKAQLLFVAITSPKKEIFIDRWREQLGVNFVMGVGGTFDVVAGKVKRAPIWMQKYGMEWFYRVMQEPRRMWKRYLTTNALFFLLLMTEKIKAKKIH